MDSAVQEFGIRMKTIRRRRRLTRQVVADATGFSLSYLDKIENGTRVPSAGARERIARALRVSLDELNGQPYNGSAEGEDGVVYQVIPALRRIIWSYDSPDDLPAAPRPLEVIAAEMEDVSRMRQNGQYVPMAPLLPPLLTELTHVALTAPEDEQRERAFWWLARGYRATNSLSHKLGFPDLSMTAIERARWAAERSGDPYMPVISDYLLLGALMRQGLWRPATKLMNQLENQIYRMTDNRFNDVSRGLLGSVVLKRAAGAARQGQTEAAVRAIEEAEEIAAASGNVDGVYYETSFGPSNIKIHEVHALIELRQERVALERAEGFVPPDDLPAERSSHHYIDLSAAQLAVHDRAGALQSLQTARKLAPNHTRAHPTVRHTAAVLARLDRENRDSIAGFAAWVGAS